MVDRSADYDPGDDAAGSASVDLPGKEKSPFDEIRSVFYDYTRHENYDPDADPIEVSEGVALVSATRDGITGSVFSTIEVSPSAAETVWTSLVGDEVRTYPVVSEGFTVKVFTKGDGDRAWLEVDLTSNQPRDPLLRIDRDRIRKIMHRDSDEVEAYAGGEYLSSETAEEIERNARDFVTGVLEEASNVKRVTKAEIERYEHEKPIELYEPHGRKVIDPTDMSQFYLDNGDGRKALILITDFSEPVPIVQLAVLDFIPGYERMALCRILEDGTINGGEVIYRHGPGQRTNTLRTFVLVGDYNPKKPIPLDKIMGKSTIALKTEPVGELADGESE